MDDSRKKLFHFDFEIELLKSLVEGETHPEIKKELFRKFIKLKSLNAAKILEVEKIKNPSPKKIKRFHTDKKTYFSKLIRERDNQIHKPIETASFLKLFKTDEYLRYITHEWDKSRGEFEIKEFILKCLNIINELLSNGYKHLPQKLLWKIRTFLFEENIENGWSFQRIRIGYSSEELVSWCESNPNKLPDSFLIPENKREYEVAGRKSNYSFFKEIIQKFRKEIRFVSDKNHFEKHLKRLVRDSGLDREFEVVYDISLKGVEAFIDVDKFSAAVKTIFIEIKNRASKANKDIKLYVEKEEAGKYSDFFIHHLNSENYKSADELALNIQGGDFNGIYENFFGNCNWAVETIDQKTKKAFRIDYLTDGSEKGVIPKATESKLENGFIHVIRMYN